MQNMADTEIPEANTKTRLDPTSYGPKTTSQAKGSMVDKRSTSNSADVMTADSTLLKDIGAHIQADAESTYNDYVDIDHYNDDDHNETESIRMNIRVTPDMDKAAKWDLIIGSHIQSQLKSAANDSDENRNAYGRGRGIIEYGLDSNTASRSELEQYLLDNRENAPNKDNLTPNLLEQRREASRIYNDHNAFVVDWM